MGGGWGPPLKPSTMAPAILPVPRKPRRGRGYRSSVLQRPRRRPSATAVPPGPRRGRGGAGERAPSRSRTSTNPRSRGPRGSMAPAGRASSSRRWARRARTAVQGRRQAAPGLPQTRAVASRPRPGPRRGPGAGAAAPAGPPAWSRRRWGWARCRRWARTPAGGPARARLRRSGPGGGAGPPGAARLAGQALGHRVHAPAVGEQVEGALQAPQPPGHARHQGVLAPAQFALQLLARSGVASSAAWLGVAARRSAARSTRVVSISCPTPVTTGRRHWATALTRAGSLKAHRSSRLPPPRTSRTTSQPQNGSWISCRASRFSGTARSPWAAAGAMSRSHARGPPPGDLHHVPQGRPAQGRHHADPAGEPGQRPLGPVEQALGPQLRLQLAQPGLEVAHPGRLAVGDGQGEGAPGHVEVQGALHLHPLAVPGHVAQEALLAGPHRALQGRALLLEGEVPVPARAPEVGDLPHHAHRRRRAAPAAP